MNKSMYNVHALMIKWNDAVMKKWSLIGRKKSFDLLLSFETTL